MRIKKNLYNVVGDICDTAEFETDNFSDVIYSDRLPAKKYISLCGRYAGYSEINSQDIQGIERTQKHESYSGHWK